MSLRGITLIRTSHAHIFGCQAIGAVQTFCLKETANRKKVGLKREEPKHFLVSCSGWT